MKIQLTFLAIFLDLLSLGWAEEKMNVLFIPIDDLKPLLGCYGVDHVKTPNMDRLAAKGTVFMNASCQQAVCGPSRASLMTGLYPDSTGVYDLKTRMRDIQPDVLTLPQHFKEEGYVTTGYGKTFDPRCVDRFFDKPSWSLPYTKYVHFSAKVGSPTGGYRNPVTVKEQKRVKALMKKKGIVSKKDEQKFFSQFETFKPATESMDLPDTHYPDGNNTTRALQTMKQLAKSKDPFFLSVGYSKPHLPFVAPKKYWDLYQREKLPLSDKVGKIPGLPGWIYNPGGELRSGYTGIPASGPLPEALQRELIHGYLACVSYVDAQVGRLLDGLEHLGIADRTIVCLWGDHGWHLGDHGNWCKHSNFEEAVRSPLIISSPVQKDPGKKSLSPVEFVDIFPTLCELTGLKIPPVLEGKSLVPQMQDASASVRSAALHQYPRRGTIMGYTLRTQRFRYVKWIDNHYRKKGGASGPLVGRELYDFEKDPGETTNLAGSPEHLKTVDGFEKLFRERGVAQHTSIQPDAFGMK